MASVRLNPSWSVEKLFNKHKKGDAVILHVDRMKCTYLQDVAVP